MIDFVNYFINGALVGFFDALLDLLQAKIVVARAQGVARLAGIDGVGAKVVGRAHFFQRAGGQEQFGISEHDPDCAACPVCVLLKTGCGIGPCLDVCLLPRRALPWGVHQGCHPLCDHGDLAQPTR